MMIRTIWCDAPFPEPVIERMRLELAPHRLIMAVEKEGAMQFGEAQVAFGQPDPDWVIRSPDIAWLQLTTAGYTRYDTQAMRQALRARSAMLTNSSSVYDEPCAQHVLAMMLCLSRSLPAAWSNQQTARGWPQQSLRTDSKLLNGQTAMLFGYGAIGRKVEAMLRPLEMRIIAVRRTPSGTESLPTFTYAQAEEYLPAADHVINLLPEAPQTHRFFNSRRFAAMKRGSVFYNVGRGATVDQESLVAALVAGHLAAAYLDVTDPEPLPPGHELWSAPNCFITPHTAGGHENESERLADHFMKNFRLFQAGEKLLDVVMD